MARGSSWGVDIPPPSLSSTKPLYVSLSVPVSLHDGEVAQYETMFRLCYLRGPAGIIVALAEQVG